MNESAADQVSQVVDKIVETLEGPAAEYIGLATRQVVIDGFVALIAFLCLVGAIIGAWVVQRRMSRDAWEAYRKRQDTEGSRDRYSSPYYYGSRAPDAFDTGLIPVAVGTAFLAVPAFFLLNFIATTLFNPTFHAIHRIIGQVVG